jgi:hypothetical protein
MWSFHTPVDLNNPLFFPHDGLRTIFATAEDLAGNLSTATSMRIFVDTSGPQVSNVFITSAPMFNLFGLKPTNFSAGPTPLVDSLTITITDNPNRVAPDFLFPAIVQSIAQTPGQIIVKGDFTGIVPILQTIVTLNPVMDGQPATATITLVFATRNAQGFVTQGEPLLDDRYTLTILDTGVVDPAGNKLDGESNASQPQGALSPLGQVPTFPSGDGQPGGNFVARFTVNGRPHSATSCCSSQYIDINGNGIFDPNPPLGGDITNRDLVFHFGLTTDAIFSGNFFPTGAATATGFSKLGAYGQVNGVFRWLLNFNSDGAAVTPPGGLTVVSGLQLNARPVAFHFNPALPGDEIALFDGQGNWFIDFNHENNITANSLHINDGLTGFPIVGDFDGNGQFDLATYRPDLQTFFFDLNPLGSPHVFTTIHFGFPGVSTIPVAADMNRDGITDIGLFVPGRQGSTPPDTAEWYFLVSNTGPGTPQNPAVTPIAGTVNTLNHPFSPTPLGSDLFFKFGGNPAFPFVGTFDPPETPLNFDPTPLQRAYQFFLGRQMSSNELAAWNAAMQNGVDYQHFLATILSSPEYLADHGGTLAGMIAGDYQDMLGRPANPAEIGQVVAAIQTGYSTGSFAYSLVTSQEAANSVSTGTDWQARFHHQTVTWISSLYHDTLGRFGTPSEIQQWGTAIESGSESRSAVAGAFLNSTEHWTQVVNNYYQTYLGRSADPAGLSASIAFLQQGGSLDQLLQGIFSSSEFFALHGNSMPAFVGSLYGDVLGRTANTAELNGWVHSGLNRSAISNFFLQSNERIVRDVSSMYQTYLGRPIDAAGLVNVEAFINSGGRIQDLLDGIFASTEYWNLHR